MVQHTGVANVAVALAWQPCASVTDTFTVPAGALFTVCDMGAGITGITIGVPPVSIVAL